MSTSPPTLAHRWNQVPGPQRRSSLVWPRVAWLLVAIPVASQLWRLGASVAGIATVLCSLGVVMLVSRAWHRTWAWAPAAAVSVVFAGRYITSISIGLQIMAVVALVAWLLVTGGVAPGRRVALWARIVVALPAVAASVVLLVQPGVQVPLALFSSTVAAMVVLGVLGLPRPQVELRERTGAHHRFLAANERILHAVGRPIGMVLGAVVMVPAAVVAVTGWVAQSVFRYDPLAPPAVAGTRWVRRTSMISDPLRSFSHGPVFDPRGTPLALRRWGAAGLTVALCFAIAVVLPLERLGLGTIGARASTGCVVPANPVMEDQPNWDVTYCEMQDFVLRPRFDPLTTYRYPDMDGTSINVVDGERATWQPPPCEDCDPLEVWWFGGSAAWGWNQRDDFTIPSQLAKRAADAGAPLVVRNFAMPAWVLRQETIRFEELLEELPAPDVVVFYDGGNELNRQKERNGRGRGTDEGPTSFLEAEIEDFLWNGPPGGSEPRTSPWPHVEAVSPERVAHHAVNRYRSDVERAREVALDAGVVPVFVWQPLRHSAPAAVSLPEGIPPEDDPVWAAMVPAAIRELPDGVLDLSDALDDADRMVFDDFYHTNEYAADVVAGKLLDAIGPTLEGVGDADREGS